jgi:hypothetical protein
MEIGFLLKIKAEEKRGFRSFFGAGTGQQYTKNDEYSFHLSEL